MVGVSDNQNNEKIDVLEVNEEEQTKVESEDIKEDDVEILSFDDDDSSIIPTVLTSKKEGIIALTIVIVIALIAIFIIPKISSILSGQNGYVLSNEKNEISNNGTVDGFLEIGKTEGSITAKKIQFYSFVKKTGNVLKFKYLPETTIKDTEGLNIYIEIYNSKKNVIYRTKFSPVAKVERKVIENVDLPLNENIYGEATYVKVVILDEKNFSISESTMTCTLNDINDIYTLNSTVVYNFSTNGLTSYKTTKNLIVNPTYGHTGDEKTDPHNMLKYEGESLSKVGLESLEYTDTDISYTVDLLKNKIEGDTVSLGNAQRQIKLESEKNKWRCE